ncbi:MAG TPA: hypothetical protein VM553_06375, partial [Dongiaceae bacterium]|nr:hypothetical protein [Dongiaceae bacterium]
PMLNLQVIGFYDQFYLAAKVEANLATDDVYSDIPFTSNLPSGEKTSLTNEVERNDYSLTLGYKPTEDLALFGGYMSGETELTPETVSCADVNDCPNTASIMASDGFGTYRQTYEEQGFFLGASYGWTLGPGRINGSLAYAMMDGEYSDNYHDAVGAREFKFEGDSNGVSAALTWTAPLTESLMYFVDGRYQQYEMDADDKSGVAVFAGSSVQTVERILGATAGVQMVF